MYESFNQTPELGLAHCHTSSLGVIHHILLYQGPSVTHHMPVQVLRRYSLLYYTTYTPKLTKVYT